MLDYAGVPATRQSSDLILDTQDNKVYRWNGKGRIHEGGSRSRD